MRSLSLRNGFWGLKQAMSNGIKREIISVSLCVTGLTIMVLSFSIFIDDFNSSIALGLIVGSLVSICNYSLNVIFSYVALKHNRKEARLITICSKFCRSLTLGAAVYFIIILPSLSTVAGIVSLFFAHISKGIISVIRASL